MLLNEKIFPTFCDDINLIAIIRNPSKGFRLLQTSMKYIMLNRKLIIFWQHPSFSVWELFYLTN